MQDDYPYYNSLPVEISTRQWLFILAAVVAGFFVLVTTLGIFPSGAMSFLPGILFAAIPLAALAYVTPQHWIALFRPVKGRDILLMVGFTLLNLAVSLAVAHVVNSLIGTSSNAVIGALNAMTTTERVIFYLKAAPQLLGEEILTILPFLALLYWFHQHLGLSRTRAVLLAWVLSALWFGAAHLPTYQWNIAQCLLVIGSARLMLTLPYMLTKNIWVSTGTHILNDWLIFTIAMGPIAGGIAGAAK
jgi:hypothetical protein